MRLIYLSVFTLLVLSSCKKSSDPQTRTLKVTLKQCGQLQLGGRNVNICFNSVKEERCPIDMECFWGGVAKANFSITVGLQQRSFNLGTMSVYEDYPQETEVLGYKITFKTLLPYPMAHPPAPLPPYEAELEITK
jgi:hypothetical protein